MAPIRSGMAGRPVAPTGREVEFQHMRTRPVPQNIERTAERGAIIFENAFVQEANAKHRAASVMISHDEKVQEVIGEIRNYNIPINREQPIELFADGLCENPGAMHIGLFARQGGTCLFTRLMFAGHGTCNEAEYIA